MQEATPTFQGLAIIRVPVSELKFDPTNARRHGAQNLQAIKGSLARFGQVEPLVVQKSTKIVIGGNGRLEAMIAMGTTEVDIVEVDMDDTRAMALSIALNRTPELAEWDDEVLAKTLRSLKETDIDLAEIGWNDDDLKAILEKPDPVLTLAPPPEADEPEPPSGVDRDYAPEDREPAERKKRSAPHEVDEAPATAAEFQATSNRPLPEGVKLFQGDCLTALKALDDNSVDAVVTDPPYGLGKITDVAGLMNAWITGADPDAHVGNCGFMGKEWDRAVPPPSVWKEVFRVLKPGGHAIVFAGTRTQDLMGISLRLAGFEVRDCINWLYGQGFPKSLDISKAIDKQAGLERERVPGGVGSCNTGSLGAFRPGEAISGEAIEWSGWGTALKPACEPALLCRKPIAQNSVAENVLEWGTGGINIDDCRVSSAEENPSISRRSSTPRQGESPCGWKATGRPEVYGAVHPGEQLGRFPANVIFSHSPDCQMVGTKEVGSGETKLNSDTDRTAISTRAHNERQPNQSDSVCSYGTETVEEWQCAEGCPVAELDRQSGNLSPGNFPKVQNTKSWKCSSQGKGLSPSRQTESGGASRFFYVAKASTSERNAGLEGHPEVECRTGCGGEMPIDDEGNDRDRFKKMARNFHPTVKPLKLMAYLVKMIAPPHGVVLDCFMGSGTTGVAAVKMGFKFVGMEREEAYFGIASARIKMAPGNGNGP